jgi:hypothetical protein
LRRTINYQCLIGNARGNIIRRWYKWNLIVQKIEH